MRNVPASIHDVSAQLIGFATTTVTDVEIVTGQTAALDITLEPEAVPLEEITVTSSWSGSYRSTRAGSWASSGSNAGG